MAEWIVEAETLADLINGRWTASTKKIVRCKDCIYHDEFNEFDWCTCEITGAGMHKDGFCSNGDRR